MTPVTVTIEFYELQAKPYAVIITRPEAVHVKRTLWNRYGTLRGAKAGMRRAVKYLEQLGELHPGNS